MRLSIPTIEFVFSGDEWRSAMLGDEDTSHCGTYPLSPHSLINSNQTGQIGRTLFPGTGLHTAVHDWIDRMYITLLVSSYSQEPPTPLQLSTNSL